MLFDLTEDRPGSGEAGSAKPAEVGRAGRGAASFILAHWPPAGGEPARLSWERLSADGSDREFARVRAGTRTAVVVYGPDRAENRSYELIGRHLWDRGRWGPEFMSVDRERGLFLIEDLGSTSLWDRAGTAAAPALYEIYQQTVGLLAEVHDQALDGFDPAWCYQTPRYDRDLILERESGYFMSAFVRGYLGSSTEAPGLAVEFEALAEAALRGAETVFMHRDFQSRNIMFKEDRPRLVDFQGARLGPPGYDLASLLYDPYTNLDEALRERLRDDYIERRTSTVSDRDEGAEVRFEAEAFMRTYPALAVCRLLQALGAYGFLTRVKEKPFFEAYISGAVSTLAGVLESRAFDFLPELRRLLAGIERETGKGP